MRKEIEDLLNKFKRDVSPLKKDIFSIVIHGSSVYSDKLKSHQDIDMFVIFKEMDYGVLSSFKKILKNFSLENSLGDEGVYYSVAGAGRGSVETSDVKKDQVFRLEIYVDYEDDFKYTWKLNSSFPHSLCKNYFILVGEDIGDYLKYVGSSENRAYLFRGFDKFQWSCCSIIEGGFDEGIILSSIQEGVFFDLGLLFLSFGINEKRKDFMIGKFKEEFPSDFSKYKSVLDETLALREGKIPKQNSLDYFNNYKKFHGFVLGRIYEKLREI